MWVGLAGRPLMYKGRFASARPPVGGFPYSCCSPLLMIRSGRTRCAPFMGQPIFVYPFKGRFFGAPLWGIRFVRPFKGRLIRCPFMGLPFSRPF